MGDSARAETDILTNGVVHKDEEAEELEESSELIILGSGSSTGVPSPVCLLRPSDPPCPVCHKAMEGPPKANKNYRIDALILTHEHADATLGLDDIRGVQNFSALNDVEPMPVFVSQQTMDSLLARFPYLVEKKLKAGQEVRRVAQLDWRVIQTSCSTFFEAFGLEIVPLPVMHGEDCLSLGFLFGKKHRVAYISDVSRIPESTERLISADGEFGPVDVLILDTLFKYRRHNTHFCLEDSLATVKRLRPKRAFFVGMTHEFDHERDNLELAEWSRRENLSVQLAYDGMRIPVHI
ncbi:hypothetical protein R1sor_015754 [Riccia sorocarpa]|uniref:Metallo-beta-lactamase domain-containing protein n=1 Tax=Riccia sorocarpa TaxID=122646 RepID=A0ABD3HD42_9MARC